MNPGVRGEQGNFTYSRAGKTTFRHTLERCRDQVLAAFVLAFPAKALACDLCVFIGAKRAW